MKQKGRKLLVFVLAISIIFAFTSVTYANITTTGKITNIVITGSHNMGNNYNDTSVFYDYTYTLPVPSKNGNYDTSKITANYVWTNTDIKYKGSWLENLYGRSITTGATIRSKSSSTVKVKYRVTTQFSGPYMQTGSCVFYDAYVTYTK